MEFIARVINGGLNLGARNTAIFDDFVKKNPNVPWKLTPVLPESQKQRRFYHGAVIPLWAYLDGKDYRDSQVLADLHEVAKVEFNGAAILVAGKLHKVGRSTTGQLSQGFLERVIGYLVDNYAIDPGEVLDPAEFLHWRDTVFAYGGAETFIDYLVSLNRLTK